MDQRTKDTYEEILRAELIPSMGCTEPVAIAYCAAAARKALGEEPVSFVAECSGNLIKNAKSVVVPNTGGLTGIAAAVVAGAVSGKPEKKLEVLSGLSDEQIRRIREKTAAHPVRVKLLDTGHALHMIIRCRSENHEGAAFLKDTHTGIYRVEKDGRALFSKTEQQEEEKEGRCPDYGALTIRGILEYARQADLEAVNDILDMQIRDNTAICSEGLQKDWGASVGRTMLQGKQPEVRLKAIAAAAAGSDARMSGCALPVVINSGSGNQGITASIPVVTYAREKGMEEEKMKRALLVSNLCAIHIKHDIGYLSAYCGVVSAGIGSICGIAYLDGKGYQTIADTITNVLGTDSGIVCDGAKSSCAMKIACSLMTAFNAYDSACAGHVLKGGDGIIKDDVEKTIETVARMAKHGMSGTDRTILELMMEDTKQ